MLTDALKKVQAIVETGAQDMVRRRVVFELVLLGILTREHVLLIGPPGTGKSAAVRAVASHVDATHFEYLLGRFTEPAELFGAMSIEALREGRVETMTEGMLPEANIAFLDEIFLGSTAILNTLLGILNERSFRRGAQSVDVPLWSCISASNALPDDPMLSAFADRFLLTTFVEPVGADHLPDLLRAGWRGLQPSTDTGLAPLTHAEINALSDAVLKIDMSAVHDPYAHVMAKLGVRGMSLSDRRIVRGQKLVAAAALLAGRDIASPADLWPVVYMVQDRSLQDRAKEILSDELQHGENPVFDQAVKTATYGPAAYAADLAKDAQAHLDTKPKLELDPGFEPWRIRAEGLLAKIDAGFSEDSRPEILSMARSALVASIS